MVDATVNTDPIASTGKPQSAATPPDNNLRTTRQHELELAQEKIKTQVNLALQYYNLKWPKPSPELDTFGEKQLNHNLIDTLSNFVATSQINFVDFVQLLRGETKEDTRPNKAINPKHFSHLLQDFKHKDFIKDVALKGIKVHLKEGATLHHGSPPNHPSASQNLNILIGNLRKEQDAARYIILKKSAIRHWDLNNFVISPMGIVPKPGKDPNKFGRTISDFSFPDKTSLNDATDKEAYPQLVCKHVKALADRILSLKQQYRDTKIMMAAGDVQDAFRNLRNSAADVKYFCLHIPELDLIVIDLAMAFGWTSAPGIYGTFGEAIQHIFEKTPVENALGHHRFWGYHWVDDHPMIEPNLRGRLDAAMKALRGAITAVLGPTAINEEKFTDWSTRLKVLGLVWDTELQTVSMPQEKLGKARNRLLTIYNSTTVTRKQLNQLLGTLRHVATCIRPARPFLQRIAAMMRNTHPRGKRKVSDHMLDDIRWWLAILKSENLNGIPLEVFSKIPSPDEELFMDACNDALCVLRPRTKQYIIKRFSAADKRMFETDTPDSALSINVRELLSLAYGALLFGPSWTNPTARLPYHVRAWIDNSAAVHWTTKQHSRNTHAQLAIRILALCEVQQNAHFSAQHIAGEKNIMADAGSRMFISHVHKLTWTNLSHSWTQVQIPKSYYNLSDVWRMNFEPKRWQTELTSDTHTLSNNGTPGRVSVITPCS